LIEWHFIGPLQSNKTAKVAQAFDWVHSVDRLKVAQRLSAQRPEHLPPLQICLQVNISHEPSKGGISLQELPDLACAVQQLPRLQLRGLMSIPAPATGLDAQRTPHHALRMALENLNATQRFHGLDTLSMGMSGDLEAAVMEGSTFVRIGRALFGARHH
jgi:PLP dependent protein